VNLDSDLAIDISLFKEDAEVTLYNAYEKVINQNYADYKAEFEALFGLKRELDSYFDDVMVNADDEALKVNRLHTIGSVYKTFKNIADIKEITV
jgi:glycyl-tRNA synthetase beta chain